MKVLIDAMLLGGRHSGVEVAIEGLCRGLGELRPEHSILVAHRPGFDADARIGPGIETLRAPAWTNRRAGRILWERMVLPSLARRSGADLLHAPGYLLPTAWAGPSVLTIYDILALTRPEWCKRSNAIHYRLALPAGVRKATVIAAPSEVVARELVERLGAPDHKTRVAHLGVSEVMVPATEEAMDRARSAYDLPARYLLWVGNIEPKKNLEGMVAAFERAARDLPHDLVLVGREGWKCRPALDAIERSPVADRIRRIGYVPTAALPALYSGADLLVHWSHYEGAGLTPLEAMACGTPAVVSDGGALPELAGQVAPVVPLGNPDDLAAEILSLIADEDRRRALSREGRRWVRQFTWRNHAIRMLTLYEEALNLGSPS